MKYIILLAFLTLAFTCALAWTFFPDVMIWRIVWTAFGFLLFSEIVLFATLCVVTTRRHAGEPLRMGMLAAAGLYVIFSIIMVPVAVSLSGFSGLLLPHFFAFILFVAMAVGIRGAHVSDAQSVLAIKAAQETAHQQSQILNDLLRRMNSLESRAHLGKAMDELRLLSERLRMCRGSAVDAESDTDLKTKVSEICALVDDASDAERMDRLPGQLNRLIVDLDVLITHREHLCRITRGS